MRFLAAGLCWIALAGSALAAPPGDPLAWLGRISTAAQKLEYSGTFIYQSGSLMETSRITHGVDAQGEFEHLVALDGSPREVIRNGGEVSCVLPGRKTVIIDQAGGRHQFPGRLPESFAGLAENYRIQKGGTGRVAGHDAQLIVLEPKDELRYGHQFWADMASGLLLKARLVDEQGSIIEQFSFSEVHIGGKVERDVASPRPAQGAGWKIVDARGSQIPMDQTGWAVRDPLPGFKHVSAVRRQLGRGHGAALHMMFSDGLAAISVFVEPAEESERGGLPADSTAGSVSIYTRVTGVYRLTALGEVPALALRRLADGLEPRP